MGRSRTRGSEDGRSELLRETSLLQNRVRGVTRPDFAVNGETMLREWAEPDLVVALTLPLEATTVREKDLLELRVKESPIRKPVGPSPDDD
jgi:hypothetical protein